MRALRLPAALIGFFLFIFHSPVVVAQEDGLFARIETSEGVIRARLAPDKAPRTVSNFVGLAEGGQKALDFAEAKTIDGGYYDGVTFHRVISDLLIQTGLRSGSAEGPSPGYVFRDEFNPDLRHDEPFVLSMANTGPHTNGSEFFITVASAPQLNDTNAVFGEVVQGQDVARAISTVETDEEDRPLTPVTIERITIERIGASGRAFQPDLAGLPKVQFIQPRWNASGSTYHLDLTTQPGSDYHLFTSPDLQTWAHESLAFPDANEEMPSESTIDVTATVAAAPMRFFKVAEVFYPTVIYPPSDLGGRSLDVAITQFGNASTSSRLLYTFTDATVGTGQLGNGTPVAFRNYFYRVDSPTRATLIIPSDLSVPFDLPQFALTFASETIGTFIATLPNAFPAPVIIAGTFTLDHS